MKKIPTFFAVSKDKFANLQNNILDKKKFKLEEILKLQNQRMIKLQVLTLGSEMIKCSLICFAHYSSVLSTLYDMHGDSQRVGMKATLPYFLKVDKQQTQGNYRGITIISEIALVIIENGAR